MNGSNLKSQTLKGGGKAAGKQTDEDRNGFVRLSREINVQKSNHLDTINGRMRLQSHICATCWVKDKVKLEHPE